MSSRSPLSCSRTGCRISNVGKQGRRAQFEQRLGSTPILNSKTVVCFDLNWNVIAISRQLMTDQKLGVPSTLTTSHASAGDVSTGAVGLRFRKTAATLRVDTSELGIDAIRGIRAWQIQVVDPSAQERFRVLLDATNNQVLNLSDDTARYTDAKVRRCRATCSGTSRDRKRQCCAVKEQELR
jgi:hypothetical protein